MNKYKEHSKNNSKAFIQRFLFRSILSIFISFLLINLIQRFFIFTYIVPNDYMEPQLLKGKKIFISKTKNLHLGDIVLVKLNEHTTFLARITAKEGDKIFIENKKFNRNGNFLQEKYIMNNDKRVFSSRISKRDNLAEISIPEKSFFLMVDNRDRGIDSRELGIINEKEIIGKVVF